MSLTLATVADALIEFILSLLRDPEVAAEFDEDPDQALAARGLQNASPSDVASVAPIIIERTQVVQVAAPRQTVVEHHNPVVREIKQVVTHNQWVDDRDTIVDQSVNQNIWAEGDVTQTFDNEAIVASGDDAVAAGGDATVEKTTDLSTIIEAGEDVNIGNDTDVQVVEDSFNEDSDQSSTVESPVVIEIIDSLDDSSTDVQVEDSFDEQTTQASSTDTAVETQIVETTPDDAPVVDAAPQDAQAADAQTLPDEASAEQPVADAYESAVEYIETAIEEDAGLDFAADDTLTGTEGETDENF
ncbi:IniB N-terminal domain-containing protein [Microbacterium sp. RU33B]|uniref:IniB N-terminal domain-containing protein n=1 Tax=Microbacterium sp. RU33B TaxID=1907390 RepID=UPI00095EFDAF|nr:IniB N-terminal domain-containing protein [Microbacterium sp. RU33B]SIT87713.1 hypothetical protein SAMN05880545_2845 [Microbacterium sp. RU33B]